MRPQGSCSPPVRADRTRRAPLWAVAPVILGLAMAGRGTARADSIPVETGRFQAHMAVALVNDGPVTLLLDTERP